MKTFISFIGLSLFLTSTAFAQREAEDLRLFLDRFQSGAFVDFDGDGEVTRADLVEYVAYLRDQKIYTLHEIKDEAEKFAEIDALYHSAPELLKRYQPKLYRSYVQLTQGAQKASHLELEAIQNSYPKFSPNAEDNPTDDPTISVNPTYLVPIHVARIAYCLPRSGTSYGRGLAWPKTGPINWDSGSYDYVDQQQVCLYNLGEYDENGIRIGGNNGLLDGRHVGTNIIDLAFTPPYDRVYSADNDFRLNYLGDNTFPAQPHEAIGWSTEVNAYHHIDSYRRLYLNPAFVNALAIDQDTKDNLLKRQYRPDLQGLTRFERPLIGFFEAFNEQFNEIDPDFNSVEFRYRLRYDSTASLPPLSKAYDPESSVGEYAGLAAHWVFGDNRGFPDETGFGTGSGWVSNITPALNDALSYFEAARYSGQDEVMRYESYAIRIWREVPCDATHVPCGKGINIDNVMMYKHGDTSKDLIFPFQALPGLVEGQGPEEADLSAMFFSAVFRDIAKEAGIGMTRASQLFWQTLYLIDNRDAVPMVEFGNKVIEAARVLWPSDIPVSPTEMPPGGIGDFLSIYEDDIVDVLTSRGIPTYGRASIQEALPPAIGVYPTTLENDSVNRFGSSHPETHPGIEFHGEQQKFWNGYHHDNPATYMAYQSWRFGAYGPCDELRFTDGTFSSLTGEYNQDGNYFSVLTGRDIANKVIIAPGSHIRWSRVRGRCENEKIGNYAEDVKSFGFRVIKATANGFGFTIDSLGALPGWKLKYRFNIYDPSYDTLGGTYSWKFIDHQGNITELDGLAVEYTIQREEPFTIEVRRTRGLEQDELVIRTRSTGLDLDSHLIDLRP